MILRLVVGLTVAGHGAQKLFGWFGGTGIAGTRGIVTRLQFRPVELWTWALIIGEFFGGLLLALGLLTPIGSFLVLGPMSVAIWIVHRPKGFWNTKGGIEFPLQITAAALALSVIGPGAYSLDGWLHIALPEPPTWIAMAVALVVSVLVGLWSRRPALAATTPRPA